MYLTTRSIILTALVALPVLVYPRPLTVGAWMLALAAAVAADVAAAPSPQSLEVRRHVPGPVRLGEPLTVTLTLVSGSRRTMRVHVRDAWPPSAGARQDHARLSLPPGARRQVRTTLVPVRRGRRDADLVTVRCRGPLGLAGRQASLPAPAHVMVLPAFSSRRYLPSRLARLREMDGRSAAQVRGAGTELDSLREYVIGDDVRSIDWRSTARRAEVVVRTWQPERDRQVLIVLDTGHLSAVRTGSGTRLDVHLEATLLLTTLATTAGDRVEVVAVDEQVRAHVSAGHDDHSPLTLATTLAGLQPHLTSTRWDVVIDQARSRLHQRSLIVLLCGSEPAGTSAERTQALSVLAGEHEVVLAGASDPELELLRTQRATVAEAYTAAAAERDLLELVSVRAQQTRTGVTVISAPPRRLAAAVADTYLDLKAQGRL